MINRKYFFDSVRTSIFGGKLSTEQVQGMEAILSAWEASGLKDDMWLAYMLGTTYHETAATMLPISEYGGDAYFNTRYGPQSKVGKALGNTQHGDGARYAGRGYVQLTGRANYHRMGKILGVDLISNPDLALQPDHAAKIMFAGMVGGLFTGKKLPDYFNAGNTDWFNARRIINGVDKAATVAEYSQKFHSSVSHKG